MNFTSGVSACSINTVVYNFNITSESSISASEYDYVDSSSLSGDQKLEYIIYRTTCKVNNKIYVGQKDIRTKNFNTYLGSGTIFKRAVKKYGRENFYRETIEYCDSSTVDELETYWIAELSATNPKIGYNISLCGGNSMKGRHHTKNTRRKLSEKSKGNKNWLGKHHTKESLKKMSDAKKGNKNGLGHKVSDHSKRKIGESQKGNTSFKGKHHTKESLKKMSDAKKGKSLSEEHIKHLSDSLKGNQRTLGFHPSEETRRKRSESMKRYWDEKKKKSKEHLD